MNTFIARVMGRVRKPPAVRMPEISTADAALIGEIRQSRLTYLPESKLASIVETIRDIEQRGLSGIFIEAGCALGGSTILISKLKSRERPLRVYDVFEMIPPPSDADGADVHKRYRTIKRGDSKGIGGDPYYGYEKDLYGRVQANLRRFDIDEREHHVSLVKGLLQETMVIDGPVAFAHIDVDWYEPVKTCLERIMPRLVAGGVVILDDYADWSGCRKAADEYLCANPGPFAMDDSAGSMKITRHA